jgi:hypothetical protein
VIKKNKSQQALQIISHVLAELYVNFAEMSKKYQVSVVDLEKSFRFRESLRTFPVIVSNNYPRISGKVGFTIELIIEVGNQ